MPMRRRLTIGALMLALAIVTIAETFMARYAIAASRDGDNICDVPQAIYFWALLHVPIAFVGWMLCLAYAPEPGRRPRGPE